MSDELDAYRLKSLDLGQLTGAAVAINSIPDAFLIQHIGVGCKHKTTSQLATHDWTRTLAFQTGWTEVGDKELILGSADRIAPYSRTWIERRNPGILYVASVTFLDLAGDDFVEEVKALDAAHDIPCVYLKVPGHRGDLYSGWQTTLVETLKTFDWKQPADSAEVAVVGYFMDRKEADQRANLDEIRRLLGELELEPGPISLGAEPMARLADTPKCATILSLPHLGKAHKRLTRSTRRTIHPVPLPMGLRATAAFLRAAGKAAGADPVRIERTIHAEEEAANQRTAFLREHLKGKRVAVFADLPLAAGWISLLDELGARTVLTGIRGHTLGGREELQRTLESFGAKLPRNQTVLDNPSLVSVRDHVAKLLAARQLDGIIGSATDHNIIGTIPASRWVGAWAGTDTVGPGPFRIETGLPGMQEHWAMPTPFLGYTGFVTQAQRLLTAPRTWDSGRGHLNV